MEKQIIIAASAMIFCVAMSPVYGQYDSETVKARHRQERMTRLHFFFYDVLGGENPAMVPMAHPNITNGGLYLNLLAMDDPLTIGPERTSMRIGNAQGLYLCKRNQRRC
ncbi:hypothetical protein V6N13_105931 [Hibiscus sabdariffa]|uniref:Dirigent protein n=1 Tax=Hibiscus sabdariffa TaxID=183260 RepID=A0ABR2EZ52_9ROSI